MTGNPFDSYYRLLADNDPSMQDDALSDGYKKLQTTDGQIHAFAPDTPDIDAYKTLREFKSGTAGPERKAWRADLMNKAIQSGKLPPAYVPVPQPKRDVSFKK